MGNKSSFMLQDEEITLISEETGFSAAQIERLYSRFTALDKSGNGSLSRQDCLAIPELAINPLCDRIVQMFFIDCDEDHERINFRQFMKVLATFRSSHKSSPLSRSRNCSRQESLSQQASQLILKQAPLLFDSIDPSPFSSALSRHSRHSSYHDGFHDQHHHRTTNQHSVHYAASSVHLPSSGLNGHQSNHHLHTQHIHSHFHLNGNNNNNNNNNHQNTNNNNYSHQNSHNGLSHNNSNQSADNQHNNSNSSSNHNKKQVQLPLVDPSEPPNSRKQKLYFMFKVYDVNNDDLIDLEDLEAILRMMVGTYVDDGRVRRIAERTLREADLDCDGYIDYEEFCTAFTKEDIDETLKVKFSASS